MVDIPNYFQRAIALLASQFQSANPDGSLTNFQNLIYAIETLFQELNTQEINLQTLRFLPTAQGVQLDGLGQIIGLARIDGQTDASYREALGFQIYINLSVGYPEQVITILKNLTQATKVWYNEQYPAAYEMATNGLIFPTTPSDLVTVIQQSSPAGVEFIGVTATYNVIPFVFSTDPVATQFYVAPIPNDPSQINPLDVNPGSGEVPFFVQGGETSNPDFGGAFAEALGMYPTYTIDTTGAGQMVEFLQVGGNIPPPF